MKFGKSLIRVVELSDPEWGPYWINYKFLKKKIKHIVQAQGGVKIADRATTTHPSVISKSSREVEFFVLLKSELKKTSDFFASTEQLYAIRKTRVWEAFNMLKNTGVIHDKNTWTRLLMACVNFYKDVLLLENFAIMSYCGYSKILKKHDKLTGFATRDAYMRNVVNLQNFTHYPYVMELISQSEKLFADIQAMESVMPLQDEERLFIEAIRDLNYQASRLQSEERIEVVVTATDSAPETVRVSSSAATPLDAQSSISKLASAVTSHATIDSSLKAAVLRSASESHTGAAVPESCPEGDAEDGTKRGTSFNPYHGPSFITAIPDDNAPYINSMCILDPSDRLDAATSLVIDAAMRLNHASATRPNLQSIVSCWVNSSNSNGAARMRDILGAATTTASGAVGPGILRAGQAVPPPVVRPMAVRSALSNYSSAPHQHIYQPVLQPQSVGQKRPASNSSSVDQKPFRPAAQQHSSSSQPQGDMHIHSKQQPLFHHLSGLGRVTAVSMAPEDRDAAKARKLV